MTLRVLFFCGHESLYGLCHLQPLLESGLEIIGVVSATKERWQYFYESLNGKSYYELPQSIWGSVKVKVKQNIPAQLLKLLKKNIPNSKAFNELICRYQVPHWQSFDVNDSSFLKRVRIANPDLIFAAAYPQIFSGDLISIPGKGSVNFHPSLLPKYRGAHPHFWAIAKGEKVSGITAHFMTPKLDDGNIISQLEIPIEHLTYSEFYKKIIEETPNLIKAVERFFENPHAASTSQNEADATVFRNDRVIHRRIFWELQTAEEIYNLCRTEKAFCFFRGIQVKCLDTYLKPTNRNLTNQVCVPAGTIVDINQQSLVVKAIDACLYIQNLEENGKIFTFSQWAKRHRVHIGERLD